MKKLSILLPTYNRQDCIEKQLLFLEEEKVFDDERIEVIVSNNGSTDNTYAVLENFKEKPNVRIVNGKENIGLIGNLRKLVDMSSGEYIWFIGDDDCLFSGIVARVMDILFQYDVGHIYLNHILVKGKQVVKEAAELRGGIYSSHFTMICEIIKKVKMGCLMFLTANIYKRENVLKVNDIIDCNGEKENLALPLGYSLYPTNRASYLIQDIYLEDQLEGISWKDSARVIWYRDTVAMWSLMAELYSIPKDARDLFMEEMAPFAEFNYRLLVRNKCGKSNAALEMLLKHYPLRLFKDMVAFPFYVIGALLHRLLRRIGIL